MAANEQETIKRTPVLGVMSNGVDNPGIFTENPSKLKNLILREMYISDAWYSQPKKRPDLKALPVMLLSYHRNGVISEVVQFTKVDQMELTGYLKSSGVEKLEDLIGCFTNVYFIQDRYEYKVVGIAFARRLVT